MFQRLHCLQDERGIGKSCALPSNAEVSNLLSCRQVDPLGIAQLVATLNLSPSTQIRAVLEHPVPNAINGKWSWFSAGYNSGIWKGVLYSHNIPFESVAAKVWKTDMQLLKTGKEGSRELAQKLLPQAIPQLK